MTAIKHNQLSATRWQLDPHHSTAEFHVRTYWGLITVHGRFDQLAGHIHPDGPLELTISAASLETGNRRRDQHLRSRDFFDTEHHPHVRFHSTSVEHSENGAMRIAGELEAAGRRVRIDLEPAIRQLDDGQLELDAETTIDQRQLGMTYRRFGIRTPASVSVHARLRPVSDADPQHAVPRAGLEDRAPGPEDR